MDVLKEFQAAIEIEFAKNLQEFEEQQKLPLDERVAKGVTMSNLKVEIEFYDGLPDRFCPRLPEPHEYIYVVKVFCKNNISKFKEGNSVVLSNGSYRFEMEIEEDSTENFILKPNDFNVKNCYIDSVKYPENNWEINAVNTNISTKLLLTAAEVLKDDTTILRKIENFLNGRTQNTYQGY